ncbi:MAG TPA: hypothetical protein VMT10_14600 [Solirubrobacteraceae bacterium]|nr:hypothetical protein [Solirubrobacteraceae bacterium]
MRKVLELGGILAALVLIAFGIGAIVVGISGRSTVKDNLSQEQIVGTPDMTPSAIKAEAAKANLPASISMPTCSVANKAVTNGSSARCFAQYMRIHALEATSGKTYAELPRYATKDGKGTNDETAALKDAQGQPVDNPIRNVWIQETALSTALNTSYMAERVATFGIVTGIAMLLAGIGLGILALFVFGALRAPRAAPPQREGVAAPAASA